MKKHLFICVVCLFSKNLLAQQYHPFPTDSAQWSVLHWIINSGGQHYFEQFKMIGDTVLYNGNTYSKLYKSDSLDYNSSDNVLHCFLREDSTKKVFVKYPEGNAPDTSEFVLYDYGLETGDTFQIRLFEGDSIYYFNQYVNIKYFNDNNPLHPQFEYGMYPLDSIPIWGLNDDYTYVWYQGIGTNFHLLYNEISPTQSENEEIFLVCFNLRGQYITSSTDCGAAIGISETYFENEKIKVVPNPVTGKSEIRIDDTKIKVAELIIINQQGEQVKKVKSPRKDDMFIDENELSVGIFYLYIIPKKGEPFSTKFIITKNR